MLDSRPRTVSSARALAVDAAVVLGVLLLLAVAAGLVWPHLVDPVEVVLTPEGAVSDEVALAQQFDDDGWYAVLAAVGGALAGALLTWWRSRDPVATVLLVVVGAFFAAWVMAEVGAAAGPPPAETALAGAQVGATAPAQVAVHATAAYLVWPIAATFGAVVVLWSGRGTDPDRDRIETARAQGSVLQ